MANHSETDKKPIYKKWWFWVIIILVIAAIGGAGANTSNVNTATSSNASTNAINTATSDIQTEQENVKVTLQQYEQIQDGMTYDEVVSIFGGKETSSSESEVAGIKSEIMTWNGNGTLAIVTIGFTNGEVSSKSQTGLE